jgi:hypothetical protein
MYRMAESHTTQEIIDTMKSYNVAATESNIAYYRHIHGINKRRYERVIPADTFNERIWQYIEAIHAHCGDSWANKNLGCHGAVWARCARRMCVEGMIERMADTNPVRYTRIATDTEIKGWYNHAVLGECSLSKHL